jgi:heat shock protein HslJ
MKGRFSRNLGLALAASSLLGCATEPQQLVNERVYQAEWIDGKPRIHHSHPTLILGQDGRAYGNGSCNHWFAAYSLEADQLSFAQIGSTRKICPPPLMEQEQRFLEELSRVQRWDFSSQEQLRLWPAEGKPMRLESGHD